MKKCVGGKQNFSFFLVKRKTERGFSSPLAKRGASQKGHGLFCFRCSFGNTVDKKKEKERRIDSMASVKKFVHGEVFNQIRHIERTIQYPSNPDIDPERLSQCYKLTSDRGMTAWDYYAKRKEELYCMNRPDVNTAAGWVVSCPTDVPKEMEDLFFYNVFDFLCERYEEKNIIQCTVHKDESGSSHLHFLFIPVIPDRRHGGEKICCKDVLNKRELRNFHPDLQKYLMSHGCPGTVQTGITKEIGGNRTVEQLKEMRSKGITIDKETKEVKKESRWRFHEIAHNVDLEYERRW